MKHLSGILFFLTFFLVCTQVSAEPTTNPVDVLPDKIEKHIQSLLDPNCNLSDQQLDSIFTELKPFRYIAFSAMRESNMSQLAQRKLIVSQLKQGL